MHLYHRIEHLALIAFLSGQRTTQQHDCDIMCMSVLIFWVIVQPAMAL